MNTKRPDNLPLPNLPLAYKILSSLTIVAGLSLFLSTWYYVIRAVYFPEGMLETDSTFGIGLGLLAARDLESFRMMFFAHTLGMVLLLVPSFLLFKKSSLRRRVKGFLSIIAVVLVLLDSAAWYRAPTCTPTNLYVGILSVISAMPLGILALVPLWQIWIFKRWKSNDGKPKQVVIVGGGFAGLYAAMGLNKILGYNQDLEITLIDKKNYFLFPPLLPSAAAGTIETRQVTYPFRRIFETTNIIFRKVEITAIDPKAQVVRGIVEANQDPMSEKPMFKQAEFKYDYLVLAPGSITQTFNTKGANEHAFFMRDLNDAVELRNQVIDCFERAAVLENEDEQRDLLRFVAVGAGPTGIETATEIHDLIHEVLLKRYPEISKNIPEVCLVQSGNQVLPGWHKDIVAMTEKQLDKLGIKVYTDHRVNEVGPNFIKMTSKATSETKTIYSRSIIWSAGVRPSELLLNTGLPLDRSGRVVINDDLRVPGFESVFVLGDAAYLKDSKTGDVLPPLGQVAFQQGSHTAKNLARLLAGSPAKNFKYFNFGGLVSVGEHYAAVNLMGVRISGFIGWLIWRTLYLAKIVGVSNRIRIGLSDMEKTTES